MAEVRFISQDRTLRVGERSTSRVLLPNTGEAVTKPGLTHEFKDGLLLLDSKDDKDSVQFLRDHKYNGRLFHEISEDKTASKEDAGLALVAELAASGDRVGLARLAQDDDHAALTRRAAEQASKVLESRVPGTTTGIGGNRTHSRPGEIVDNDTGTIYKVGEPDAEGE